jgi:hypothetical protein
LHRVRAAGQDALDLGQEVRLDCRVGIDYGQRVKPFPEQDPEGVLQYVAFAPAHAVFAHNHPRACRCGALRGEIVAVIGHYHD